MGEHYDAPELVQEQPPVAPVASDKSKVKRGCMIGCMVLLILGAILIGGCFAAYEFMKSKMGPHLISVTNAEFEKAVEEERIPDADLPLYSDLVALAETEGASFYTIVTVAAVVIYDLEDGTVSDEERTDAKAVLDFFGANPGVSMFGIATFYGEHPAVQEKSRLLQQSPKIVPTAAPAS